MAANQSSYQPYIERLTPAIEDYRRLADLLNEQGGFESLLPDLEDFIGRHTEMLQAMALWQQLRAASRTAPGLVPVPMLVIVGQSGVGKSAFALRLAERVRPAAQLYFNLRSERSVAPAAIVQQVQSALATAGKGEMLILLDNLEDETLIHALLALGSGYMLLVTSRQPLTATLNVVPDAVPDTMPDAVLDAVLDAAPPPQTGVATLELPALSELDAIALLQSIVKSKPVQADCEISRSIVRCCNALPLALRIVGGLLQTQPQLQLSDCLQRLSAERQRCDQTCLSHAAIRASFNLSYQYLDARSTHLLRWLGLLPEPSIILKTAAALSETSIYLARDSIAHLLRVRLLEAAGKERYCLPDLLRLLAKGQLAIEESAETRQATRLRLCETYHESAEVMSLGLDASSRQHLTRVYGRGRAAFEESLSLNAQNWFTAERLNLLAAVDWAFAAEAWTIGLGLVHPLAVFLAMRGEWTAVEALLLRAISVAERLTDRLQTAQLLTSLGNTYLQQGKWEKAKQLYQQSLEILHDLQAPVWESQTLANLGRVHLEQSNHEAAAALWKAALTHLPTGSSSTRSLMQWMQATHETLLETVLLQLDDRQASPKFLGAIGGMFKRLLS